MTSSNRTGRHVEKHHRERTKVMRPDQPPDKMEQFRNLLFDLSARFISVLPSRLGTEISEGLRLIGEFWDFDKIILAEMTGEGNELAGIHFYFRPGLPQSRLVAPLGSTPWFKQRLLFGEAICLSHLPDDVPESETTDREYCLREGIKSSLILPLIFDESIRGALTVMSLTEEYTWTDELIKELHLVGEIMASALERKKIISSVQEHMEFEHLLSDISGTYINLPVKEVELHVKQDLGLLAGFLGAGRCVLYLAGEDRQSFSYGLPFVWWPDEDNDFFKADNDFWLAMNKAKEGETVFFDDLQYIFKKWSKGEPFQFSSLEELPEEAEKVRHFYARFGVKSYLSIPILVGGSTAGALVIATTKEHRIWPKDLIPRIRLFGEVFINALIRRRSDESLRKAFLEVRKLKERIEKDYIYLKEEINLEHDFRGIIGRSDAMKEILVKIKQVAPTNVIVLLLGETGTGKGLMAREIHNASKFKDRPLVQVNCAALSPTLIESELFGYEKGAFTGAQARRIGRFEVAHGTTLFLDEIGELSPELQAKLLRVLQDGEFERVGGNTTIKTDVRIIAATNKDLVKEVEAGRFRQDLWYRLSIFPIHVPPLRERFEDVPLFVSFFVDKYAKWIGKKFDMIPQKTINALQVYAWPGNIRELENIIERAVITSPEGKLQVEIPGRPYGEEPQVPTKESLDEIERAHILKILGNSHWVIEGPKGAARRLGLTPSTLRYQAKRLGITRP